MRTTLQTSLNCKHADPVGLLAASQVYIQVLCLLTRVYDIIHIFLGTGHQNLTGGQKCSFSTVDVMLRGSLRDGGANWSTDARVLLNVTFQEPGPPSGDEDEDSDDKGECEAAAAGVTKKSNIKKWGARLCEGGWEDEVEGGWKGGKNVEGRSDAQLEGTTGGAVSRGENSDNTHGGEAGGEVRRIHGFTYHSHESVTGRFCVADFL